MATTISRISLALAGALLATHPALAQQERLDGVTLRVATWGGGWVERVQKTIQPQLVARGAKIEYVIGTPDENFAKLIAARGQKPKEEVSLQTGAPPVIQQAADALKTDRLMAEFLPRTPEAYAQMYFADMSKIDTDKLIQQWNRTVLR